MTGADGLENAVAIVGVGGVFPGARTAGEFWTNVLTQTDCIRELPRERFDSRVFYDPDPEAENRSYCRVGGVVEDIPLEPRELRMPPLEANEVDRLQLLAFAAARDALRDAGYDQKPFDRSRTAVILGQSSGRTETERSSAWRAQRHLVESVVRRRLRALDVADEDAERAVDEIRETILEDVRPLGPNTLVSMLPNVAAGRIASALDLHGPNYVVDSACASSLAALDQAVEGLLAGQFDCALTGGSHGNVDHLFLVAFSKYRALSPTRCRPFEARADGFVVGEGAGVFVVKRLADALRDEDRIYAVVRGVGSSSDGRWKSLAAPNPRSQALAIRLALERAGYGADTLQFVETHGTGTSVGDRAEILGMLRAFEPELRPEQRISLGAAKSHVGHLMGAAGAAGLTTTILGLHHEVLPPVFRHEQPNPAIPWDELPFDVVTEPTPWPQNVHGLPRRAGVSSLGFGGTNFHVALEAFDPAFHARAPARRRSRRAGATEPVAIVGIASVLPEAGDVEEFWQNVLERRCSISPLPEERFEGDRTLFVDRDGKTSDTSYTDLGSVVDPPALDTGIFPMTPKTLERLDPEHRLFLSCAARALADAGYAEDAYDRSRVAIVAGDSIGCRKTVWNATIGLNALRAAHAVETSSALERLPIRPRERAELAEGVRTDVMAGRPPLSEDSVLAQALQVAAARVTKAFDWTGPHMIVDAACASGLGALGVAVGGLRSGRWDLVLTGSSSGGLLPAGIAVFAQTTALSATGSRPLSRTADGLVLGEGTVLFVLKRLRDALRDDDRVYAVVRGVGASSDGKGRALMAPNPDGQVLAIERAWDDAGLDPATVQFVECHATATRLGDDVEIESMRRTFGGANGRRIGIGSVKSQIGHLGGGAAGPSLLKTVLGLHRRTLPPTVLDGEPIPALAGDGTPFAPVVRPEPWPENDGGEPRRAAVNSFGFGGTNFHVVVEEFDGDYHSRLVAPPPEAPARAGLPKDAVAFLFPGQGAWYPDMLRELHGAHGVVRDTFQEANDVLLSLVGETLERILFTSAQQSARDVEARLLDGELAQPALVATSVALDRLLRALDVAPDAVAGHSLGDYAALVAAGVLRLEDALRAAHARARALRELGERGDAGRMAAVLAGAADVQAVLRDLPGYAVVANLNSRSQTVVSGEARAVELALERLGERGIESRALPIAAAFHSRLAAPAQPALASALEGVAFAEPRVPCLSSVTGELVPADAAAVRRMLVDQLCAPVDFVGVVRRLYDEGVRTFVEVGPKRVLTPFVENVLDGLEHVAVTVAAGRAGGAQQLERAVEVLRRKGAVRPGRIAAEGDRPTGRRSAGLVPAALEALSSTGFALEQGRVPADLASGTAVIHAGLAERLRERARLEETKRRGASLRKAYLEKLERAASDDERLDADRWFAAEQAELWNDAPTAEDGERPAASRIAQAIGARGPAIDLDADSPVPAAQDVARALVAAGDTIETVLVFSASGDDGGLGCTVVRRDARVAPPPELEPPPAPVEVEPAEKEAPPAGEVAEAVLAVVSELTGYEPEFLELDLDLEADLGIDSIKQAQILSRLAERYDVPLDPEEFRPGDFPTLRHVIELAASHAAPPGPSEPASSPAAEAAAAPAGEVTEAVLDVVSELTGYEPELLELDLDLEADLGIDSIKQAQILSRLAERYDVPLDPEEFRPGDFPTLRHVIELAASHAGPRQAPVAPSAPDARPEPAESRTPRLVVSSRPASLELERRSLSIGEGWNVCVLGPDGPSTKPIAAALERRGARVARAAIPDDGLDRELQELRARCGPFDGLVLLHGVGVDAQVAFAALAALAGDLRRAAERGRGFVVSAGRATPDGAALAGLLRCAAKELPGLVARSIELTGDADPVQTFLAEVERAGPRVDAQRNGGERRVTQIVRRPVDASGEPRIRLDSSSVVLLVGGGRGITAEIAKRLASSFRATLVLWGTSAIDDDARRAAALDDEGLRALRQERLHAARRRRPDASPRALDEELQPLLRAVETQRTLEALERLGARSDYRTVDVRDAAAVEAAMKALLAEHGRLDGLVFGAGTIEDKLLEDKHPSSFRRVFEVKARGIENVVNAFGGAEPRFVAALSSVAGTFGNRGQADYAAANAYLERFVALEGAGRRGRWFSIAWGPWAQVGLAARSGVADLAAERGLALVDPAEGAAAFERELLYGEGSRVVLASDLEALDAEGSVSLFDGVAPDGESAVVATRTFALERDPWLHDHVIGGTAVLPGVVGIELLVGTACELLPGRTFAALHDLRLERAVKLLRHEPVTVRVRAERQSRARPGTERVRVRLETVFAGPGGAAVDRLHFEGTVELADAVPASPASAAVEPPTGETLTRGEIYGPRLPHGPAFQVLERVSLDGDSALGELSASPRLDLGPSLRTAPVQREAALQTAGLHALVRHGVAALPAGCRLIEHFGEAPAGVALRARARLRAVRDGDVEYDLELVGDDGLLYNRMSGYRAAHVRGLA